MARTTLTPEQIKPGLRVAMFSKAGAEHARIGMLTGKGSNAGAGHRATVIPEGCSNGLPEEHPLSLLEPLPIEQQIEALGGQFVPPPGYPFVKPHA